jgi:hypothetical protein
MNAFRATGRATQKTYESQVSSYGFSKNRPINLAPASVTAFTNIVWRATKKVAFALRGDLAVLAYCTPAAADTTCYDCTPAGGPTTCGAAACKAGTGCATTDLGYCENVK